MIRVLIVDDQVLFAQSLKITITNYSDDIEVVGLASDGADAIDMAESLHPDVILMDVYMKIMDGVKAAGIIHKKMPEIKIFMLSTYGEDDYVRQALSLGISGYLMKDISPTELITAIRAVNSGMVQLSPVLLQNLIQKKYVEPEASEPGSSYVANELVATLTKREREIFTLIATGYENDMIAEKLNLSKQTVRNYVSLIYEKLNVKDRFEIIRLANKV